MFRRRAVSFLAFAVAALAAPTSAAPQEAGLDQFLDAFHLREIGPAVMGGRVSDLAIHPSDPNTWYVGLGAGGVWKTTNHGMTWTTLFDDQPCPSIGAVAVAPSNPNVVWVGTGEPANRQSSPWGCGLFRSTDAGRTWTALGLEETRHVSRIEVHPADPDVAYVAAVGHLWGPNEERGVYRTMDGGATWEKVLYLDENTGPIDLAMDPADPRTLFAAMYSRRRTGFGFSASGGGGGLYRTMDGGETWTRLTEGLPQGEIGRIGIDIHLRDPNLIVATVEASGGGTGFYRSTDRGDSWERVSTNNPRPMYFSRPAIDPSNPDRIYMGGVGLQISDDGGRTWWEGDGAEGIHVDHHAIWVNPADGDHVILGNDGGLAYTFDGAGKWRFVDNMAIGQLYEVDFDMRDPYYVCGGLQDNGNWCAPNQTLDVWGVENGDWFTIHFGDGFHNHPDPTDWRIVYTESQGGNLARVNVETGESQRLRPVPREEGEDLDFNWNTPIVVSRHDPATIYIGANLLFRSRDRGITWERASPDLTRQIDRDTLRIFGRPLSETHLSRNDGISSYGNITAVGESPLDARVLYVGTDDGNVQVTRDGGASWTNVVGRIEELPGRTYVSRLNPSHHEAGRVYASFDGHRNDDYRPHVYVSEDYGQSWRRITAGLPDWSVNAFAEHPGTPGLLFVGNEVGVFVSFDRGARWERLQGNFPVVSVDDLQIHPRDDDLIVGTHGRSVWVLHDLHPLAARARSDVLAEGVHLFQPEQGTMWARLGTWPFHGDQFVSPNPEDGVVLHYWLRNGVGEGAVAATENGSGDGDGDGGAGGASSAAAQVPAGTVRIVVSDAGGTVLRTLEAPGTAGLHRVVWDFRMDPPTGAEPEDDDDGPAGPLVMPGTYSVRLEAGGQSRTVQARVRLDPRIDVPVAELEERQRAFVSANALAGPMDAAAERVDALGDRLDEIRELLDEQEDAPAALRDRVDSLGARLERVEEELDEHDNAPSLRGTMEGWMGRPTADQLWQIDRAWEVVPGTIERLNTLLTQDVPALEAELERAGIRSGPGGPVEVPRRPPGG